MFTPNQFIRPYSSSIPSTRLVLQKMTEQTRSRLSQSKSRWDQPITVPQILYMKFKLPIPTANNSRQSKIYPLSLIDFIKRAYDKCKDQSQAKLMENQLKLLLAKYEANYYAASWESMAIPTVGEQKKIIQATNIAVKQPSIKTQTVNLSKQHGQNPYQIKNQEQITSKTKMKLNKTLQKLQQKLNKKEQGKNQAPEPKTFVGFSSNRPQNYRPQFKSQINPTLRVILNPLPPPPPPQTPTPLIKPQKNPQFGSKKNALEQKFQKSNYKPFANSITVTTSTTPEPINSNQNYTYKLGTNDTPVTVKPQQQKQKTNKIIMSRKEFTQISKVAEKVSDYHQVAKRYESFNKLKPQLIKTVEQDDLDEDNDEVIVGKNNNIDKPYLRITGRPDPDLVRPEPILKKALAHFLQEFKKGTVAYDMFISQLKSIRQDLTVQHIRNSFTVEVYEQNFKISLYQNDIIQVKHCQANLWEFYREGLVFTKESRAKFIGFNFLTLILQEKYKELEYMLTLLPEGSLDNPEIQESLKLKKILMVGNYKAFFDYYNGRDQISRQLLNIYIDKVRMRCIVMFSKTCGQKITFSLLGQTIGEDEDIIQALACGEGAVVRQGYFMLKQSFQKLSKSDFLVTKKVTNLLT